MKLRMRQSNRRPLTQLMACAVLALAAWPAQAAANHTVVATDFKLTASNTDAGASPDASSWTTLVYPGVPNTDDIKHTIGHFAAGMVANPEIVPKCPRDVYLADQCPADTLIGSSEADMHVLPPVGPVLTEQGRIYNVVQQGAEAGRLGIIVDAAPPRRSSRPRSTCATRATTGWTAISTTCRATCSASATSRSAG